MSPSPQLAAPGSSGYSGPTMQVGDGTWDATSNTFLLPNLQGFNLATTQYNGMGARFANMPQYFTMVEAHGILAAITFLFVVPFAVLFVRFYQYNPRMAIRIHIWCQIFTLLLTTAIFILGFIAVGPSRNLTNPHHVIGLTLFVAVLLNFILGWLVHRRERRHRSPQVPVRTVLHRWLGRGIAILGFAQVALGLALYGSPTYLFVLYALVGAAIFIVYFVLSVMRERRRGRHIESDYSWASGTGSVADRPPRRSGSLFRNTAAGAGIGSLVDRFRRNPDPALSQGGTGSYTDEKYSEHDRPARSSGWKSKALGIGALATAGYWAGRVFGRHRDDVDTASYTDSRTDDLEEVGNQHTSPTAHHPFNPPVSTNAAPTGAGDTFGPSEPIPGPVGAPVTGNHRRRHSGSSVSYDSYESASPSRHRRRPGILDAAMGLGGFGFARDLFKRRKDRKEQRRIEEIQEQEAEAERVQRANSRKYTGDTGIPHPGQYGMTSGSTHFTPVPEGDAIPASGGHAPGLATSRPTWNNAQHGNPAAMMSGALHEPAPLSSAYQSSSDAEVRPGFRPSRHGRRPHGGMDSGFDATTAALAGGASGMLAGEALADRHHRDQQGQRIHQQEQRVQDRQGHYSSSRRGSGETIDSASPRASVKLNMHRDGRHVTLRRLTEEEAAAERARQARARTRRRRAGESGSTLSGSDDDGAFRRADTRPSTSAGRPMPAAYQNSRPDNHGLPAPGPNDPGAGYSRGDAAAFSSSPHSIPPGSSSQQVRPPAVPGGAATSGPDARYNPTSPGSIGSPGALDGNVTESSVNYENNRRRRRAERAAAAAARQRAGEFD